MAPPRVPTFLYIFCRVSTTTSFTPVNSGRFARDRVTLQVQLRNVEGPVVLDVASAGGEPAITIAKVRGATGGVL